MVLDEYYALDPLRETGAVKTQLLAGRLIVRPLPEEEHVCGVMLSADRLRPIFGDGMTVRQEHAFMVLPDSDPNPDIAVVPGTIRQMLAGGRPTEAVLILEVADDTLATDTGEKAELYAKAGVEDYWVLDVNRRRLFVFRSPIVDADREHGHWYASVQIFDETQSVAPLAAPSGPASGPVAVADLLP